jgi:hypothetical protein
MRRQPALHGALSRRINSVLSKKRVLLFKAQLCTRKFNVLIRIISHTASPKLIFGSTIRSICHHRHFCSSLTTPPLIPNLSFVHFLDFHSQLQQLVFCRGNGDDIPGRLSS